MSIARIPTFFAIAVWRFQRIQIKNEELLLEETEYRVIERESHGGVGCFWCIYI